MLQLHNLVSLKKKRKRVGRGGSRGGTSGKGHKGQKARSGGESGIRPSFEGGQMPLSRRLPRRGFTNVFKVEYEVVNLRDLEHCFKDGESVDKTTLMAKGLIKGRKNSLVKILANGTLTKNLAVQADRFSKTAQEMIEKAGGSAKQS